VPLFPLFPGPLHTFHSLHKICLIETGRKRVFGPRLEWEIVGIRIIPCGKASKQLALKPAQASSMGAQGRGLCVSCMAPELIIAPVHRMAKELE
jgi:hypothetical protein